MNKVSLQDIADKTHYSRSTVSLALRNNSSISRATRDKIYAAAKELGYRPSPLVGALMSQIRHKRRIHTESIALISRFADPITSPAHSTFYHNLYAAITERSEQRGYKLDEFYLGKENLTGKRLTNILVSRGIHGVILFPGRDVPDLDFPDLDWERFATVLIGYHTKYTHLHQVASNYSYDIEHAIDRIRLDGYRRIGLAITETVSFSCNRSWLSRFLLSQYGIPSSERVSPYIDPCQVLNTDRFLKWYQDEKPEVVLVSGDHALRIFHEAGIEVPKDVRVVNLAQRGEPGLAGINPHTEEVGHLCVDLLASLLQTNEIGRTDYPRSVYIKGHWTPGESYINKAH